MSSTLLARSLSLFHTHTYTHTHTHTHTLSHILSLTHTLSPSVPDTMPGDCSTGQARLAQSTTDPAQNTRTGTLQICLNNAWGWVCSDNLFSIRDAEVACQHAGGYEREIVDLDSVAISGAQFLSQLVCEGDETTLLECESHASLGSECNTGEAPVLTCRGE